MTTLLPTLKSFTGTRITFHSGKPFDLVAWEMHRNVGEAPVQPNDIAAGNETWDRYEAAMQSHVGPGGFILFSVIDHGAWIKKTGIQKKAIRFIVGNPMIAITMIRHDITAGLFAPVELLLTETENGECDLMYIKPSSLIVTADNEALQRAASVLDSKLEDLARKVAS